MSTRSRELRPRKQPRQQRSEETRDRILDAAADVFARYGYAAGTTNRIAETAEISVGSLYQYYPNKDAILLELVTRHYDAGIATDLRLRRLNEPDSLRDVVVTMVRSNIDNHRTDPELLRVMIEQAPRSGELLKRVAEVEGARITRLRAVLERSPEVTVDDEVTAAHLVVSTIEMMVHHLMAGPAAVDPARLEIQLVEMIYRYLTAGPPVSPPH